MNNAEPVDHAYEEAWQSFVEGGKTEPAFGASPSVDRMHLVFLCSLGADSEVTTLVAPIQKRLAFEYADLVPPERLHVSVQGLDVNALDWAERRDEILAPARAVFSRCPAFKLRLGWLNSFPMAAFLRAEDGGMIRRLRTELRATLPPWAGLSRDPLGRDGQDGWLPHLSLVYYNAVHNNRVLVDAIAPLRQQVVVVAPVEEIHLISTPSRLVGADRWTWPLHQRFELVGKA